MFAFVKLFKDKNYTEDIVNESCSWIPFNPSENTRMSLVSCGEMNIKELLKFTSQKNSKPPLFPGLGEPVCIHQVL